MELTIGDLIILELAMSHYLKGVDLSMQAGQQCSAIIGKIEYKISEIANAMSKQGVTGLTPPA